LVGVATRIGAAVVIQAAATSRVSTDQTPASAAATRPRVSGDRGGVEARRGRMGLLSSQSGTSLGDSETHMSHPGRSQTPECHAGHPPATAGRRAGHSDPRCRSRPTSGLRPLSFRAPVPWRVDADGERHDWRAPTSTPRDPRRTPPGPRDAQRHRQYVRDIRGETRGWSATRGLLRTASGLAAERSGRENPTSTSASATEESSSSASPPRSTRRRRTVARRQGCSRPSPSSSAR
jgi:hypothetical protein